MRCLPAGAWSEPNRHCGTSDLRAVLLPRCHPYQPQRITLAAKALSAQLS